MYSGIKKLPKFNKRYRKVRIKAIGKKKSSLIYKTQFNPPESTDPLLFLEAGDVLVTKSGQESGATD